MGNGTLIFFYRVKIFIPVLDTFWGGEQSLEVPDHVLAGAAGLVISEATQAPHGRQPLESPRPP